MAVVEFHRLDPLWDPGMVLQDHHITWHECPVQLIRYLDCLLGRILVRFRYDHQHVLVVKVKVPYVREYCAKLADAIQFQEFNLAIHDGLLCKWTRG